MPSMKSIGARQRSRSVPRSKKHTAWRKKRGFGKFHGRGAVFQPTLYIPYMTLPTPLPGRPALYSSVANTKQIEDFANQYAATWARELARRAARSERTGRSR